MLLTMSSAGTTMTRRTHSRSRPCIWSPKANTEARTTPAAPGLGRPMKYRLSAVGSIGRVEPGQPDRGARQPHEAGDPAEGIPLVAALGEQRERQQGRGHAERDQVGQGVELQAERGHRADQPCDGAVGDVEDDREADEHGSQLVLPADRHQDRAEPAHHVGEREQAGQRREGATAAAPDGAADELARGRAPRGRQGRPLQPAAGKRAMTVSPPRTRWPLRTVIVHSGGRKTSIREPNFIRPIRSPVASG